MLPKMLYFTETNFHVFYAFRGYCIISLLMFGKLFEPQKCV